MVIKVIFALIALAFGALFLYFGIRSTQKKAYWETVGPLVVEGHLLDTNSEHDVYPTKDWGHKDAKRQKTVTGFRYGYEVEGKEYVLVYDMVGEADQVPQQVEIHCNSKFPGDAYIPGMTPEPSMNGAKSMLYVGLFCLVAAGWILLM